ncbi:MAG: hypothetical protein AB8F78_14765 [Saprospiraceae bacterium]
MKTLCYLLVLGFGVSLITACGFTKDLQSHQAQLLAATGPNVSISEKRDVLAISMVGMMHDAVDRLNPKQGVKYVKAYAKTNGPIVDTLTAQILRGQQQMTDAQRIGFMLPVLTKPYAKEAISLMPRFIKRYKQYQSVIDLTGQLKKAALGKLGSSLGGFGESLPTGNAVGSYREREAEGCAR